MDSESISLGGWMERPQGARNCPPGLEYLTRIDQVFIHQEVEMLEVMSGYVTKNRYTIKNGQGQKIYYAVEDSNWFARNCCGENRAFEINMEDKHRNLVMHLSRPDACTSCCFPCCLQSIVVSAPVDTIIGSVHQEWSICRPWFTIRNPVRDVMLVIEGPYCTTSICGDVKFKVLSADMTQRVGMIAKKWSGIMREMFTDADYFEITFPMNLDVKMKAAMMGACILIDAMYFESTRH